MSRGLACLSVSALVRLNLHTVLLARSLHVCPSLIVVCSLSAVCAIVLTVLVPLPSAHCPPPRYRAVSPRSVAVCSLSASSLSCCQSSFRCRLLTDRLLVIVLSRYRAVRWRLPTVRLLVWSCSPRFVVVYWVNQLATVITNSKVFWLASSSCREYCM